MYTHTCGAARERDCDKNTMDANCNWYVEYKTVQHLSAQREIKKKNMKWIKFHDRGNKKMKNLFQLKLNFLCHHSEILFLSRFNWNSREKLLKLLSEGNELELWKYANFETSRRSKKLITKYFLEQKCETWKTFGSSDWLNFRKREFH